VVRAAAKTLVFGEHSNLSKVFSSTFLFSTHGKLRERFREETSAALRYTAEKKQFF
jgi:hypothetical protein